MNAPPERRPEDEAAERAALGRRHRRLAVGCAIAAALVAAAFWLVRGVLLR